MRTPRADRCAALSWWETLACHLWLSDARKSDPADLGDVEPLADSTASQARRVVAAYATDADECRVFLAMLGIGPSKLEA